MIADQMATKLRHAAASVLEMMFMAPVLADQELKVKPQYWEGAVDVSGLRSGAGLAGRGYVELVGYDRGTRAKGCHSGAD